METYLNQLLHPIKRVIKEPSEFGIYKKKYPDVVNLYPSLYLKIKSFRLKNV